VGATDGLERAGSRLNVVGERRRRREGSGGVALGERRGRRAGRSRSRRKRKFGRPRHDTIGRKSRRSVRIAPLRLQLSRQLLLSARLGVDALEGKTLGPVKRLA